MGIIYYLSGKLYDFLDKKFEEKRYFKIRHDFIKNIKGTILDAGCGTGRNFIHYNKEAKVIAIDKSEKMLEEAKKRIKESKANIKIQTEDLTKLHFKDNNFDNIVATFVLCVMPKNEEIKALKELIRVAKPEAKLFFLEYVYSKRFFRRTIMKLTAWIPRILYSMRYNTTLIILQKEPKLKIEKVKYVWSDILRLIIVKKIK